MRLAVGIVGIALHLVVAGESASIGEPRFFTGIFLNAIADDSLGGTPKETSPDVTTLWDGAEDVDYYENEYEYENYDTFNDYKHTEHSRRRNKKLSIEDADPLGAFLLSRKSQSTYDGEDEDDDGYDDDGYDDDGYDDDGYDEDDDDNTPEHNQNNRTKKRKKRPNQHNSEEDDDSFEEADGYDEDDEDDENIYEEDDEYDESRESNENTSGVRKKPKRKKIVKNVKYEEPVDIQEPDEEGNVFIEIKDKPPKRSYNKKRVKKKKFVKEESEEDNEDDDDNDEVVNYYESGEDDDDNYEERSVKTLN